MREIVQFFYYEVMVLLGEVDNSAVILLLCSHQSYVSQ